MRLTSCRLSCILNLFLAILTFSGGYLLIHYRTNDTFLACQRVGIVRSGCKLWLLAWHKQYRSFFFGYPKFSRLGTICRCWKISKTLQVFCHPVQLYFLLAPCQIFSWAHSFGHILPKKHTLAHAYGREKHEVARAGGFVKFCTI
jgi:hypothetical protein